MTYDVATIHNYLNYLVPPPDSYWKWSDDGEAIVWVDGRTIVFRKELAVVLRRQISQGLPLLTPVVLLLAACRDSWNDQPPPHDIVRSQFPDIPNAVSLAKSIRQS